MRKYLAEFVGTLVLVLVGSMSIVTAVAMQVPVILVVPFGFGLGLLAAIVAVGDISGGHFNPAITLAALLDRRISPSDAAGYVVAQVLGAIGASGILLLLAGQASVAGTANHPGAAVSGDAVKAFGTEIVLSAIFVLVVLTVTKRAAILAPLAIPSTLVMIHFAGVPFSGASVNPARSLGPALVGGNLSDLWIYLTAPLVGAAIGCAIFRAFEWKSDSVPLAAPKPIERTVS
jgi:aquaporin Z